MPAITAPASLNCGMTRGLTKEVASTTGRPDSESRLMNCIFCSVGMDTFSFCKPSRGPTSTIRTEDGTLVKPNVIISPPVETRTPSGFGRKQAFLVWGRGWAWKSRPRFCPLTGERQMCGLPLRLTLKKTESVSAQTSGTLRQGSKGLSCLQHRLYLPRLLTTSERATD